MHPEEILKRRHLPHWYVPGAAHFVTWRLFGTLPLDLIHNLRERAGQLLHAPLKAGEAKVARRARVHKLLFADYDAALDANRTVNWLSDPRVADTVRGNLYHHHTRLFHLIAYCVMPNHVHALFVPITARDANTLEMDSVGEAPDSDTPLSRIMHSLKSYTAHRANELLGRSGPFWQPESYDHWVRDEDELDRIVAYIVNNPVKAGLVQRPEDWLFCSCHDRFVADGDLSGYLPWTS